MKDDEALYQDIVHELNWEPSVCACDIKVNVTNGNVYLTGCVQSLFESLIAQTVAKQMSGVKQVMSHLTVRSEQSVKTVFRKI